MNLYESLPKLILIVGHPAFGGLVTAVGLVMLYSYGKSDTVISHSAIIDPSTFRPAEKHGTPKEVLFWRAAKVVAVSACIALIAWSVYFGPLANYFFAPKLSVQIEVPKPPINAFATNIPYRPLDKRSSQPESVAKPGEPSPSSHPPPASSQPNPQQTPPPSSPAPLPALGAATSCPTGSLTASWALTRGSAISSSDPPNFLYELDDRVTRAMNPLLTKQMLPMKMQPRHLNYTQLGYAVDVFEEIHQQIPRTGSYQIGDRLTPTTGVLTMIKRSFDPIRDSLEVVYENQLAGGDSVSTETKYISIDSLPEKTKREIKNLDDIAESWDDEMCQSALRKLNATLQ